VPSQPRPRWPVILGGGALVLSALVPGPGAAQVAAAGEDPFSAGRFDGGKMWTFEYAPSEYFSETYGFDANAEWFRRVQLSVLRIPGCSASFVSPDGLVVTNHHCARRAITSVQREGENLLDSGFYAETAQEERPIPDYYADQLIHVEDVSAEVLAAVDAAEGALARQAAREEVVAGIQARFTERFQEAGSLIRAQVIALYNGGRYSAYVFRRLTDVRLVAAVELQLGFFGGDPDNFTYPRYALDFTFYRIYDSEGQPLSTDHYLDWSLEGVQEGDAVFVVGNPGPTSRGTTMAQLEFLRDIQVPVVAAALSARLEAMQEFYDADPVAGEAMDLRNRMFSLSNSLKANEGRLAALHNEQVMARRADAERRFLEAMYRDPELSTRYGGLVEQMAAVQEEKRALAGAFGAFAYWGSSTAASSLIRRAVLGAEWLEARDAGVSQDSLDAIARRVLAVPDLPDALDRALLEARMESFLTHLGPDHPVTEGVLAGREVAAAARDLLASSHLVTRERARLSMETGTLSPDDPAIELARAVLPLYLEYEVAWGAARAAEQELAAELGGARFAVYGTSVPPDATSSPRITDGVVSGYDYNGTIAPPFTTFFGVYDRHFSAPQVPDWSLPEGWLPPPAGLDLNTPLNFVSTADTYGGNSGSPAVTPDLQIVGLNFDRNIQGLTRDYIYLPEQGRNIMVDVRAILESLDDVYDADRIVVELIQKRMVPTEAEADALGSVR
jgi:hypothetical protein